MTIRILTGDCRDVLATLPDGSVQCCVTSPPYYGLRDYKVDGQIGLELSPDEYVAELVAVFREVRRVLRDDGTLWLNLGDSYASSQSAAVGASTRSTLTGGGGRYREGSKIENAFNTQAPRKRASNGEGVKEKDLLGIPWMVAFAMRADGWYLRSAIVWHKPNPMPESVTDRPTSAYEMVFLMSKSAQYFYDADAIREDYAPESAARYAYEFKADVPSALANKSPALGGGKIEQNPNGRNARNVWTIATQPFPGSHFATMPPDLAERCILAGSAKGDTILDPFGGAGTTALVADRLGRNAIIIEMNADYAAMARNRIIADAGLFADVL